MLAVLNKDRDMREQEKVNKCENKHERESQIDSFASPSSGETVSYVALQ